MLAVEVLLWQTKGKHSQGSCPSSKLHPPLGQLGEFEAWLREGGHRLCRQPKFLICNL